MFQINVKCDPQSYARVMVQSLKYRNCDLVPGALIYFQYLKGARPFETGRLFRFSETTECSKQNLKIYLKRDNSRNCNSNKLW